MDHNSLPRVINPKRTNPESRKMKTKRRTVRFFPPPPPTPFALQPWQLKVSKDTTQSICRQLARWWCLLCVRRKWRCSLRLSAADDDDTTVDGVNLWFFVLCICLILFALCRLNYLLIFYVYLHFVFILFICILCIFILIIFILCLLFILVTFVFFIS